MRFKIRASVSTVTLKMIFMIKRFLIIRMKKFHNYFTFVKIYLLFIYLLWLIQNHPWLTKIRNKKTFFFVKFCRRMVSCKIFRKALKIFYLYKIQLSEAALQKSKWFQYEMTRIIKLDIIAFLYTKKQYQQQYFNLNHLVLSYQNRYEKSSILG